MNFVKEGIPSRIKDNREHGAFLSIQSYISSRTFAATPWEQDGEEKPCFAWMHLSLLMLISSFFIFLLFLPSFFSCMLIQPTDSKSTSTGFLSKGMRYINSPASASRLLSLCLSHYLCAYQVVKRKIRTGLLLLPVLLLPCADICHTRRL